MTKRETSLQKWLLLYPIQNSTHQSFLSFCKIDDDPFENDISSFSHKEWSRIHMNKYHRDAAKMIDLLSSKNIFDNNGDSIGLLNIFNGKFATENITLYLLSIKICGGPNSSKIY